MMMDLNSGILNNNNHNNNMNISGNISNSSSSSGGSGITSHSRAVLEQRRAQHRIGTHEFLFLVGNRFLYYRAFVILYITMILSNFALLLWISLSDNYDETLSSPIFFFLEIAITLLLGLEVGIKMVSQKRLFWRKLGNIFDAFLLFLCFISIAISLFGASKFEQIDETFARSLLVIRYVIQFIRLCSFIQSRKKIGQLLDGPHHGVEDIDFSGLEEGGGIGGGDNLGGDDIDHLGGNNNDVINQGIRSNEEDEEDHDGNLSGGGGGGGGGGMGEGITIPITNNAVTAAAASNINNNRTVKESMVVEMIKRSNSQQQQQQQQQQQKGRNHIIESDDNDDAQFSGEVWFDKDERNRS
jgi:hypothetical protein